MSRPTSRLDPPAVALLRWCLRDGRWAVTASSLCGLGFQAGMIALPWCLQRALDRGVTPGDRGAVVHWAVILLLVSIGISLSEAGMRWWVSLAAARTLNRLVLRMDRNLLGLDARAIGRFGHGDLVVRGTRDVDGLREWLITVPSLVSGSIGFVTVLVVVARLDPELAAVGLGTLPFLIALNAWYPRRFARVDREVSAAHGSRAVAVEDLLSAGTAVRGLGGESVLVERHHERSATVSDHTLRLAAIAANWSAAAPFVPALATGVGLAVGGLAVLDGRFSVGGLVAFAGWMALLGRQVMMLTDRIRTLGHAYVAAGRIGAVLDAEPVLARPAHPVDLPASGVLAVRQVRIATASGALLTVPDLTVRPGEFVVIDGATGSGKTSLLRLLCRLADPASGTITFAGVDLRAADLEEVRRRITLVPQRSTLVSGTIGENLRLGLDPSIADDELLAACRVAAVDDVITAAPDGLDTVVAEHGHTLSGGQVQRLALARALLRRAPVLLLDDVTSAIDALTEATLLDRLLKTHRDLARNVDGADGSCKITKGETAIVAVSSRPSVLARADRVITLDRDRTGTDPELLEPSRG